MEPLRALISPAPAPIFGRGPVLRRTRAVPQLIFFAVLGVAAFIFYRAFVREAERVTARVRRAEDEARTGAAGTLVKDPETGEYRLAKD